MPDTSADSLVCRACGEAGLRPFLSLGKTPLADALLTPTTLADPEPRFPLDVAVCPSCTLVQILEEVPPQQLFVDNYLYFSSFSDHLLEHARAHAQSLVRARGLGAGSLVVELASNDGYLLRNFVDAGVPVLGVDPAPDQAAAAEAAGVPTLQEFFGTELAHQIRATRGPADVIIANNVMAHVPDLNGFVEGMRILLADDGLITIENPYVRDLVRHCEFDTIYHEHYCYFSCTAVDRLMRRHGLFLNDVEYFPQLHGGTLRWHVGARENVQPAVREHLAQEAAEGMAGFDYYATFGERVESVRNELVALLQRLKAGGARIAGYGAAAKGSTLLNYAGIDGTLLDYVVDRNVHKQGCFMPGVRLPIRDPSALLADPPDYLLLLAWNFADEIRQQQQEFQQRGGQFIVPVPKPAIV